MSNGTGTFIRKEELADCERFELSSLADARGKGSNRKQPNSRAQEAGGELAKITTEARDAGYAAGLAEGRKKAAQEADRIARIAAQAENLLGQSAEQFAGEVVELALDIARQMVRTELKVRRETLLPVVREAIDCLPHGSTGAQLLLNPADVELVRAHIGDELKANTLRVVEDHRIEPGGCRIVSPACEVDATLATRWKRLVDNLGVDQSWLDV